jgi:acyl-CoA thioesterase-1
MLRYAFFVLVLTAMACSREPNRAGAAPEQRRSTPTVPDSRPVILAFGDSLTAGHGVDLFNSYPSQLQKELDKRGYKYRVVNGGISGDTTSGGLSRIDSALSVHPKIVILELAANDGLRGIPIREAKRNLEQMIIKSQDAGATVVLAGMTLPLNYGPDYIHDFETMFPDLARQYRTVFIPFFLENVAARMDLNQEDGIHPTAKGYSIVTQTVLKYIEPLLSRPD